jgi:hypothetical protein
VSDLGPAIVTGSVAIVVAAAGFISTGMQAARTQRVQDKAAHRDEKRRAYANCMTALYATLDAERVYLHESGDSTSVTAEQLWIGNKPRPMEQSARDSFRAETELAAAIAALRLVAPRRVTALALDAARAVTGSQPGVTASVKAVAGLLEAMREDLGYPPD